MIMSLFHGYEGFFVLDINFVVISFIFSFLNFVKKQMKASVNILAMIEIKVYGSLLYKKIV
jgi:hypothetical protein